MILYEDEYIVAANKPAKLFVHPMPGERESKDCLLFRVRDLVEHKLYPINRLDRPVSGIVLFAKQPEIVTKFQEVWHAADTHKKYLCLHRGKLDTPGRFDSALSKTNAFNKEKSDQKQEALTLYNPIQFFEKEFCTYTEVEIKTGRYHQIRRHFRKAVMPIIGDRKHGKGKVNKHFEESYGLDQIFLHCHNLELIHPLTNEELKIHCELTGNLKKILEVLKSAVAL